VQGFFKTVGDTLEFSEFDPREFYASGDVVIALGHFTAKVKDTGRSASAHWAHVFTIAGGKVVKFREYTDTAAFAEAYTGITICRA
jgi:ketosteroid isomerase-like protein